MRSSAAWLLLASVHQEPVPFQVTAAGSCAQVTRPGTTPRGTPIGESDGAKSEERSVLAAATESANCRRVIFISTYLPLGALSDQNDIVYIRRTILGLIAFAGLDQIR
jgi:hypothetical protein